MSGPPTRLAVRSRQAWTAITGRRTAFRWEGMGIGLDEPASWRGWEHDHGSAKRIVTAARLRSPGESPSGLFPKTRSWLALDSPLELLSPLSVLRVNFVFGAVAFT